MVYLFLLLRLLEHQRLVFQLFDGVSEIVLQLLVLRGLEVEEALRKERLVQFSGFEDKKFTMKWKRQKERYFLILPPKDY